jgi:single-stranded DNA-binding protein
MVFVQGDLNARQYTTKDGRSGISLDVTVDKFQFAGGAKKEESATPSSSNEDPLGTFDDHPF